MIRYCLRIMNSNWNWAHWRNLERSTSKRRRSFCSHGTTRAAIWCVCRRWKCTSGKEWMLRLSRFVAPKQPGVAKERALATRPMPPAPALGLRTHRCPLWRLCESAATSRMHCNLECRVESWGKCMRMGMRTCLGRWAARSKYSGGHSTRQQ